MISTHPLQEPIEAAWEGATPLTDPAVAAAVEEAIELLDSGAIRVASKQDGAWIVHEWVKKAILLYFRLRPVERMEAGVFEYSDKIAL
ncbi:MAG TPA: 2,3,4,5-tetrahydropyridine-2,6-dicarboxylate N-succinyltransferase, partial [Candidatus Dormibacteraeota bacterium]|nr:2,3,4,5-tetrahydropyridine-2,6-dicarboxylate N-succinyltransferase [Candidatus Dormibacteraeota bacterium]